MIGKDVEVNCGNATGFSGEVISLAEDILSLKDRDGRLYYVAISSIIAVSETNSDHTRPGFMG